VAPGINLTDLQRTLDAQGLEVVDNQKESVVGRKALADKTRGTSIVLSQSKLAYLKRNNPDFKKLPEDEKPQAFKGLLKCTLLALTCYDGVAQYTGSVPD
jgi:homeobox protein cut-like